METAVSHLGIELQISLASSAGINGELGRPVHDAASGLQARSKGFHLCSGQDRGWVGDRRRNRAPEPSPDGVWELGPHLVWEAVWRSWLNVGDERRVPDVLIITDDMHGILPGLRGPVPHVTRAVAFVITLNLGL